MSEKRTSHHDGSSSRTYTAEQKSAVLRVRKCEPTAFYAILDLEQVRTTCSESDIKKAYRKLSLLTHPDKNGYPGADEAFKMVGRAFQILSDADKRAKYDRWGGDPESRFGRGRSSGQDGPPPSPFSGFAQQRAGARGAMFEEEISPEELFRQFFGGGMGGMGGPFGGLGGGRGFAFNSFGGGPGIRIHQFGGDTPRRRPHNHADVQPQSLFSAIQSLLPLLLLFVVPLLSSLWSSNGGTGPSMRFDAAVPPHTLRHTSGRLNVPYWVDPSEVDGYSPRKWRELDQLAERKYISQLSSTCEEEQTERQRLWREAQGFLSIFPDQAKAERARRMPMPACEKLGELGYRVTY
ncbi:DUF1977-domain-containing protein [Piedraia hortae CBS 480.64]|uniref:DUF1977-domain-containing protein n=1 Tax=Piedraia hortae CBS 480.64 TaxID=1314780 RepID=A0A6A7C981_9PEZI|nr:DUF1977-domain-containing protein [Piedraia hortae CBS 480.64]